MATPPASPPIHAGGAGGAHSGPAWTRNVQKPSPRVAALGGSAAGASASNLSLASPAAPGTGAGTGTRSPAPPDEAPYLTHIHRHHGQLTLVAPDNLGARRQPGTIDPPHLRHDAGGGWGVIEMDDPDLPTPEEAAASAAAVPPGAAGAGGGKKLKLKKGTSKRKREKEQKEKRERAIASAVANAGKSPAGVSPLPSPAEEYPPPPSSTHGYFLGPPSSNATTPRASPGLSTTSTQPGTGSTSTRPGMTPRSTSGTSSSLQQQATTAAASRRARRTPKPTRAGAAAATTSAEDQLTAGSSSRTSGSSALGQSPNRRPLEGPRPQPLPFSSPSESVRSPPIAVPAGSNIPAYLSTTTPTQPFVSGTPGGPLQQSRAVARARAARNAHAAVMQAGLQARAEQALRQLQDLNSHEDGTASAVPPTASGRQRRPKMRPRASDPPVSAPETLPPPSSSPADTSQSQSASAALTGANHGRTRPGPPRLASPTVTGSAAAPSSSAGRDAAPSTGRTHRQQQPRQQAPDAASPSSAAAAASSASTSTSAPAISNDPSSSSSAATAPSSSQQHFVLPPLNLSDPSLLEDHLSLGLLDPALLLMSPPPAYTGRRSLSSTRTMSTLAGAMGSGAAGGGQRSERSVSPSTARGGRAAGLGLGMEPIRADDSDQRRYSIPPSDSPPPPHSDRTTSTSLAGGPPPPPLFQHAQARTSPPPPLTSSSEGEEDDEEDEEEEGEEGVDQSQSDASPAASDRASSSSSSEDDDDDDASSFEVTSTDPLVLAWEADRSAGIYSLDERIARDLERRRVAAAQEEEGEEQDIAEGSGGQADATHEANAAVGTAGTSTTRAHAATTSSGASTGPSESSISPPRAPGASQAATATANAATAAEDEEDLALLRRRISHAEASNNSRGVVRALSVHATRSLRAQGRVARERRGRTSLSQSAPSEEGGHSPVAATAAPGLAALPVPETISEREETVSRPELSTSAVPTPAVVATSSTTTTSDDTPARSLSLRGHRMLAEAAERRMRAEKESRLRTVAAVEAQPRVVEEGEAEAEVAAEPVASASSPPPTPPRPRAAPPPPPPRSRPSSSSDRSPAPAFASSVPSIAWGAAALPTPASLRRPASIRRVPLPPPPNAAEILAARRASLRPVRPNSPLNGLSSSMAMPQSATTPSSSAGQPMPIASNQRSSANASHSEVTSGQPHLRANSAPTTVSTAPTLPPSVPLVPTHARSVSLTPSSAPSPSPPRRRPLPVPPSALGDDRVDAFTALSRQAQGVGGALGTVSAPTSPAPLQTAGFAAAQQQQQAEQRMQEEEEPSAPGPPLPRRPPRRDPPAPPVEASATTASADQLASNAAGTSEASSSSSVARPSVPAPAAAAAAPPLSPGLSMYTDLDLLLARLESQENGGSDDGAGGPNATSGDGTASNGGQNYDDLLLLSDVLGQAVPSGATPAELAETLTVARVECERRRVTKSGKVKSKLSVVGVRCVDCAICLARFKVDQFAVVLPDCLHIFHEHCIRSWFRLSRVCPVCRDEVFKPRSAPATAGEEEPASSSATNGGAAATARQRHPATGNVAGSDHDLLA
ncbi:hypothetical protein JCM10908_004763 [Rhodotorula pacifica]|uniref:uncharacterized protein n=1 Tax=Rhodotorula pacifica TaxID=1495444 RepID=UPI00317EC68F